MPSTNDTYRSSEFPSQLKLTLILAAIYLFPLSFVHSSVSLPQLYLIHHKIRNKNAYNEFSST